MRGERKGKLCSFQIADESAIIRATAWNEKADEIEKFNEGDAIEIENAYTKEGRFGVELHLGYSADIKKLLKRTKPNGITKRPNRTKKLLTLMKEKTQ